ncbi:hypothetical protein GF385_00670, partial [Candidatus Dependentiae bacterium]|nr:hypothetical protein [Candidatus Dependentiae bacterium]
MLLVILFFIVFCINLARSFNLSVFDNIRISFLKTYLLVLLISIFITESLSFFNAINYKNILFCWILVFFLSLVFLIKNVNKLKFFFIKLKTSGIFIKKNYLLLILVSIFLFLIPLFFIAYYYPPNTGDSLGYHLPRVEHWIKNKNVDHYPTGDIRQLFHQPLSEFVILNLNLLSNSDNWANYIQFFAMIGSIFLITLLVKFFGLDYRYQILSAILSFTVSMGILQATSTQTDYL